MRGGLEVIVNIYCGNQVRGVHLCTIAAPKQSDGFYTRVVSVENVGGAAPLHNAPLSIAAEIQGTRPLVQCAVWSFCAFALTQG